ncbi:hypothetical protein [Massilia sp. TS11]|uniref:hypothetical protein n=1 Tax=Massilia sp. TS11 TaxID=2908003 RepID=UPI001EDA8ABC|nr:hypothetical protein [Massilia sp. TS11]MCG2586158.1 hypothetical protein [Massilia sp. TS11]
MADKKLALVTIHGMGKTDPHYQKPLEDKLRKKLGAAFGQGILLKPVYYQGILQPNENEIWLRTKKANVNYQALREFILFGFGDAAGLETNKEEDGSVYELAQAAIAAQLLKARDDFGGANAPVVFITHSLGCQVLSNYIYDAQVAKSAENGEHSAPKAGVWKSRATIEQHMGRTLSEDDIRFLRAETCAGWVSTGCNIPIFVAAHQQMQIKPIAAPTTGFKWLNIYDPDDALGWPLRPLKGGYEDLVKDIEINAGQGLDLIIDSWNPLAHNCYWEDDDVVGEICHLIAEILAN